MEIRWLADDRDIATPDGDVRVERRQVVDVPVDVARDLIHQELAEMANKPKKQKAATAADDAPAAGEEG